MASNRHLGRIIVLQSLYEYEFRAKAGDATADINTIVAKDIEPYEKALGDTEFVYSLAQSIAHRFAELDRQIQPMAPEWPLDTIAAIDRNILRMGLYELQESAATVPPKVAINEAVELAKAFGSDNSSKFVNGVLGTAYRQIYGDTEPARPAKSAHPAEPVSAESTPAESVSAEPTSAEPAHSAEPASADDASVSSATEPLVSAHPAEPSPESQPQEEYYDQKTSSEKENQA